MTIGIFNFEFKGKKICETNENVIFAPISTNGNGGVEYGDQNRKFLTTH